MLLKKYLKICKFSLKDMLCIKFVKKLTIITQSIRLASHRRKSKIYNFF
jgi:hypothetical protein